MGSRIQNLYVSRRRLLRLGDSQESVPAQAFLNPPSTVTDTGFTIVANPVISAITYEFQIDGVTVQNTGSRALVATGLTTDQEYSVRVRAINGEGPGEWSNVVSVTPGTLDPPVIDPAYAFIMMREDNQIMATEDNNFSILETYIP